MSQPIQAIAVFHDKVSGTVLFTEEKNLVRIDLNLSGLKKNAKHGFHVHESGDLSEKCESMCAHFNPFNKKHGCPGKKERHIGDLGNIITDYKGNAIYTFYDDHIKLRGTKANIIGRGLIIHSNPDDCGYGDFPDSLTTGHSGKRIACAVIGYSKNNFIH